MTNHGLGWFALGALILATVAPGLRSQTKTEAEAKNGSALDASAKPTTVRPSKPAQAALRQAAAVRKGATGKKGAERKAVLASAVAAYTKVAADFAAEPVVVAAARFAAADLSRSMGDLDLARQGYQKAIELDGKRFAARGQLELAHLARRQKDLPAAIGLYRKVAALQPKLARGHQARLWIGRCQDSAGQQEEAVKTFREAVDLTPSPRQAIDACNRLANLLVKLGRLDEAGKILALADQAAAKDPGVTGKNAERAKASLAKAAAKMSARRSLQRALDKKNKAHQDALEVEKRRGSGQR